jgi:hypothetical protein
MITSSGDINGVTQRNDVRCARVMDKRQLNNEWLSDLIRLI